ncbi:adenylate/guanylate cyclase domain-containing protein [Chitinophagaceae bacterium LB-8]|uniref:Adenylate/guanylate cyclase domain-containing protein n=1 Tax=Paraflavisolibacter caeni TaxID=2982496 RepID=A0A9X3BHP2_9BACT|nr:adenylate/guanylate cyclase domain-containing protein [Paraflavisolibacter caeni]MCU7552654.1 adenylate/guanylate cyclase domain-containing protein [Paraflavisolibacter caeni]
MHEKFDYTTLAQRFSARFPVLSYVGIQINFWIVANILLGVILHLHASLITQKLDLPALSRLGPVILVAVILGILYGISLGLTDHYLDKNIFRKQPLGKVILLKTIISLCVLILLVRLMRFVFSDFLIYPSTYKAYLTISNKSWEYFFYILVIYYFFMTLVINFINQVNKKYGPGVLVPILLGKYRNPREEERIFLFMDLKSSTATAEQLGHLKYSSFIRDSFMDINQVLSLFNAEVYQYVGDEIVVTWRVSDGLRDASCIRFFFACEKQFLDRSEYYSKYYGFLPNFKAGLHLGKVTAVEIGVIKRDIAYHGDTLNTAARIQSVCNEYNKKLLISESLLEKIDLNHDLKTETLGMIQLRGKTTKVGIASVNWIS